MGAEVDSVAGGFTKDFERKLTIGLTGGYMRNSGLTNQEEINATFGAATAYHAAKQEFQRIRKLHGIRPIVEFLASIQRPRPTIASDQFRHRVFAPREKTRSKH